MDGFVVKMIEEDRLTDNPWSRPPESLAAKLELSVE
jgi:hypothetical protein